nr:PREDICTED: uncharacterized protein LOC106703430 [Latimeria chalumnae]|eukprot:XP_014343742.1 PREDICTED: uncharacterized protein LOC106703430 [Latimeria chalumnae]
MAQRIHLEDVQPQHQHRNAGTLHGNTHRSSKLRNPVHPRPTGTQKRPRREKPRSPPKRRKHYGASEPGMTANSRGSADSKRLNGGRRRTQENAKVQRQKQQLKYCSNNCWHCLTSVPTITPIPCNCQNNGTCRNGVCICSDEWTGDKCQTANFCNSSVDNNSSLTFDRIIVNRSGYSNEKCEADTPNAHFSKATRMCLLEDGMPVLSTPRMVNCNENLDTLAEQVKDNMTVDQLLQVATSTQVLTSQADILTTQNITSAAGIAQQILSKSEELASVKIVPRTAKQHNYCEKRNPKSETLKTL